MKSVSIKHINRETPAVHETNFINFQSNEFKFVEKHVIIDSKYENHFLISQQKI